MTRLDERYLDTSGKKILRHDLVYKASSHLQTHIYSVGERPGAIKVRPIILSIIWLKSEYGAQAISLIHDLSSGLAYMRLMHGAAKPTWNMSFMVLISLRNDGHD